MAFRMFTFRGIEIYYRRETAVACIGSVFVSSQAAADQYHRPPFKRWYKTRQLPHSFFHADDFDPLANGYSILVWQYFAAYDTALLRDFFDPCWPLTGILHIRADAYVVLYSSAAANLRRSDRNWRRYDVLRNDAGVLLCHWKLVALGGHSAWIRS